jgi:outer membrane protein TolC
MRKIFLVLFLLITSVIYGNDIGYRVTGYSLTFAAAAELALAASAELRQARASQALREGAWMWGLRTYFPHLTLSVSENDRLQKIGADSFVKNYGISVDQLLWDGGKTSISRKLERMELNLSSSGLERMASEIAEAAIAAYRNVLSSRTILKIREESMALLEEQRRILNEEVELGLALPLDLTSADINLADAKLDIFSLQLDLKEMERQFAELLGLESLPVLEEKIETGRSIVPPAAAAAGSIARERNPDLLAARFSITKKQAELKYASRSWIPNLRLTGSFGLSGQYYPLTRYNWSVGVYIDFSNPWFQNKTGTQAGWEPPYDRTAMIQNSFDPVPDPAAVFGVKQARLALAMENDNYNIIFERVGRMAANAVEKYTLAGQKRILAINSAKLGAERSRLEEIRLDLGQITRLKLMETLIEQTQREIAVVEAAIALLEAERELERFLNLKPGEFAAFAASVNGALPHQRKDL